MHLCLRRTVLVNGRVIAEALVDPSEVETWVPDGWPPSR